MMRCIFVGLMVLGGLSVACSSRVRDARTPADAAMTEGQGRRLPMTKEEEVLLGKVAELPTNGSTMVGGLEVVAFPPYDSASGYRCRRVMLNRSGEQDVRLACGDEEGWFFAPDVTGANGATGVGDGERP